MASTKQRQAAKRNVGKAIETARRKRTIANLPSSTRSALGQQAAAVRQRGRTGASSPKTRQELYESRCASTSRSSSRARVVRTFAPLEHSR